MIVYSTASDSLPMVRVFTLTASDVPALPLPAYSAPMLPLQARRYAILTASEAAPTAPRYSVVDCHSDGAAVYSQPRYTLAPALTEWQSEVIAAVQHLRRWRLYSDSPQ